MFRICVWVTVFQKHVSPNMMLFFSYNLLTKFKINKSLFIFALKIYTFFILGSIVIKVIITSILGLFKQTIVIVKFEVA